MSELLKEKQWYGEFFIPDHYEKRFSGKLEYSPTNGIMLSYSIPGNDLDSLPDSKIVHGILNSGEKCTLLIDKFYPRNSAFQRIHDYDIHFGKVNFAYLLIGDFITDNELFFDFEFSLINTQQFFFSDTKQKNPLFNIKTQHGEIIIGYSITSNVSGEMIFNLIHSNNEDAINDLKETFEIISKKYPNTYFHLENDREYRFYAKMDLALSIQDISKYVTKIANLFAVLLCHPVYPENIQIIKKHEKYAEIGIKVYPNMFLNKRTIELCKSYNDTAQDMPISNSNIDLTSVITKWLETFENHWITISMIQNRTGFIDKHSLYGEIVLCVTLLEDIYNNDNKFNEKKYQYTLETYGCNEILQNISKIFLNVGITDIGVAISDLRNEIAHVGRPQKILKALSFKDIIRISRYMELTILGYTLHKLGINQDIIEQYQKMQMSKIP